MTTDLLMSIKDIAQATQLTPRMINLYRAAAEKRLSLVFGRKDGRTTYFNAEEVREILKSRDADRSGNAGTSQNYREAADFSNANAQAEGDSINGMESIVQASDSKAAAIGQAMGNRFIQVVRTTALATMQAGFFDIGKEFNEMYDAVALPLNHQPSLQGSNPAAPQLESYDD